MATRIPQVLLTLFAGLITPFLIFPLLMAEGGYGEIADSKNRLLLLLAAAILLCTGISSWRPIVPAIYALTVFGSLCATGFVMITWRPGNLGPLLVFFLTAFGFVVALASFALGLLVRQLAIPASLVLAGVAFLVAVASSVQLAMKHVNEVWDIVPRLREIRHAELLYAAARPDHTFSCNGPDLPGLGKIEWGVDAPLGSTQNNRARVEGYWIYLQCEWSAHPHSFVVRAVPIGSGAAVTVDDQGRVKWESP